SSWEKGRIENINGLVRQYITKDIKLNNIDDETIKQVQYKLNRRPRKKLDFDTPKSSFFKNINNFI
ncbi:MAG: IS30 family transposase, partial [Muribaculaceae bacterium]|nr:IS30 family transposase [Muribaculaceae bacterium]